MVRPDELTFLDLPVRPGSVRGMDGDRLGTKLGK
jgi:hypothetical protein